MNRAQRPTVCSLVVTSTHAEAAFNVTGQGRSTEAEDSEVLSESEEEEEEG